VLATHLQAAGRTEEALARWGEARDDAAAVHRLHEVASAVRHQLALTPPDSRLHIDHQLFLASTLAAGLGELERAEQLYRSVAQSAHSTPAQRGGALAAQALVLLNRGRVQQAADAITAARSHASSMDSPARGSLLASAAQVARAQGQIDESISLYRQALRLEAPAASRAGYHLGLGNALVASGRQDEGEPALRQALALYQTEGLFNAVLPLFALAGLAQRAGRLDESTRMYHEARVAYDKLGNGNLVKVSLSNLAFVALLRGEPRRALVHLDEANLVSAGPNERISGYQTINRAAAHILLGDTSAASTLTAITSTHEDSLATLAGYWVAIARRLEGQLPEAGEALATALAQAHEPDQRARLLAERSLQARLAGDLDSAQRALDAAAALPLGDRFVQLEVLCEQGMLRCARGLDAAPQLARAVALLAMLEVRTTSTAHARVDALAEACSRPMD
jgi:tetratricopeptide (TPR) repeat protein